VPGSFKDSAPFCRSAIIKGLTQMLPGHRWVVRGLIAISLIYLCGCGHSTPKITSHESEAKADTVPAMRDADDAARFIGGLPGKPGSPFATLEATSSWKEHSRRLDEAWHKTEGTLISGLREFQKEELDESPLRSSPDWSGTSAWPRSSRRTRSSRRSSSGPRRVSRTSPARG